MKTSRQNFAGLRKDGRKVRKLCVAMTEDEHEWLRKVAFLERKSMASIMTGFMRIAREQKKGLDL